jgi:hypothetical protein
MLMIIIGADNHAPSPYQTKGEGRGEVNEPQFPTANRVALLMA